MSTLIQRSFSGGEIAPPLYSRVDLIKYVWGLRTLRNFFLRRHGGADNRPGTAFVGEVKDSTKTVRLIRFVFNSSQTYVLEFGDFYMRVHRNGVQLTDLSPVLSAITNANPCVLTAPTTHGFTTGDEVFLSGIVGPIGAYLNNRNFKVTNLTATTFSISYMSGAAVDSTAFGSYTSGGIASRVYTLVTPFAAADLPAVRYQQSADVVTLTHPSYAPQELKRTGNTAWTISPISFVPAIANPSSTSAVAGAAGTLTAKYKITAVSDETGEESAPAFQFRVNIGSISQASQAVVGTTSAHLLSTGETVKIFGASGMTQINGLSSTVTVLSSTSFSLDSIDSTSFGVYSGGGQAHAQFAWILSSATPTSAAPNVLTVATNSTSGIRTFNIYKELNGVYGLLGVVFISGNSIVFNDIGVTPDTKTGPPNSRNPFNSANNYPTCVTYHQQRLMLGNTNTNTETVYGSRSGRFKNFTISQPIQSDDAVTFSMAGTQVNGVKHLVSLGLLIVFTTGGEWAIGGDVAGVLRPGQVNPRQYSDNGSGDLAPITINGDIIYLQARGSVIRDLAFVNDVQGYRGNDLTVFSAHLFDGFTIVDWAFQQIPHSVVWAVRSDGVLLSLTYIKEQQIWGWGRHDTDGFIENVCSVPEGSEDAVYLVVRRTVNGRSVRYIERMKQRRVANIVDSVFVDAGLTYDGRNTGATTMTLSGGSQWLQSETLTLTASASFFTSSDVGNQVFLNILDSKGNQTDQVRFTITGYTSGTVVTGTPHKTVPSGLQAVSVTSWSKAISKLAGLWHLEGKSVSILGDGFVVANPNNPRYALTPQVVTNGALTLPKPYAVIQVGLPYISDMETLDVDSPQETLAGKKMIISRVIANVEASRGIFAGPRPPTDDSVDPLENLYEAKLRQNEAMGSPDALVTDKVEIQIQPEWNSNGRVFLRQVDPLPLSMLSISPDGMFPFKGGQ